MEGGSRDDRSITMDADSPVDMTTVIIRHHVLIVVGGRPVDPYIHILLPSAFLWLISNLSRFGKSLS